MNELPDPSGCIHKGQRLLARVPGSPHTETVIRRLRRTSVEHLKVTHMKLEPLHTVGRVVNWYNLRAGKSLQN